MSTDAKCIVCERAISVFVELTVWNAMGERVRALVTSAGLCADHAIEGTPHANDPNFAVLGHVQRWAAPRLPPLNDEHARVFGASSSDLRAGIVYRKIDSAEGRRARLHQIGMVDAAQAPITKPTVEIQRARSFKEYGEILSSSGAQGIARS